VLVVEDFLSEAESADIIETAKSKMGPRFDLLIDFKKAQFSELGCSTVSAEGSDAKSITQSSRTSSTAWLNPSHYALGAVLRRRVSELVQYILHIILLPDMLQ
jgi:hypothetical protein